MSSYLSSLITTTTSRYNSLRRQLTSSEADGDTEDDTHVSRVLRAYYTEKGRPFPDWLPPDPKAPQQAPAQFISSAGGPTGGGGGGGAPGGRFSGGLVGKAGGLSDLWDGPKQAEPPQEPQSLRPGGRGVGLPTAGKAGPGGFQPRAGLRNPSPAPEKQARPLPSQRAGSYQSSLRPQADLSPPANSGAGTAQERLKAKLWGGRSPSPGPSTGGMDGQSSGRNPYNDAPSGGRFSSPAPSRGYDGGGGGGDGYGGGGGGGGRSGNSGPYMSANSPWSTGADQYGGGGFSQPAGLPSGPRQGRMGLPKGPRPKR